MPRTTLSFQARARHTPRPHSSIWLCRAIAGKTGGSGGLLRGHGGSAVGKGQVPEVQLASHACREPVGATPVSERRGLPRSRRRSDGESWSAKGSWRQFQHASRRQNASASGIPWELHAHSRVQSAPPARSADSQSCSGNAREYYARARPSAGKVASKQDMSAIVQRGLREPGKIGGTSTRNVNRNLVILGFRGGVRGRGTGPDG